MASSVIHPFCTHVERHPIMLALYETIYHYRSHNLHHLKLQCVQWYGRHSVSHSRTLSRRNIWTSLVCIKRFFISFLANTQPSIRYEGVPQSVEIAANGRRLKIEVLKGALWAMLRVAYLTGVCGPRGGGGVIYYFGCCLCFCGLGVNCTYISWPASLVFDDRACLTVITNWAGRSLRVLAFIPLLVVEATLRYSLCWLRSHCWLPLPLPLFLFELRK